MNITVTLYGRYKKIANGTKIELTIPDKGTIRHIVEAFSQRFPEVRKDKTRMMVTINQQFCSPETVITSDDQIGIAPPLVAGG